MLFKIMNIVNNVYYIYLFYIFPYIKFFIKLKILLLFCINYIIITN